MSKKQRRSRGKIQVSERGRHLEIRFMHRKIPYRMSFGLNIPSNRYVADRAAAQIQLDLATGDFDPTLSKYRPSISVGLEDEPLPASPETLSALELWDQFTAFQEASGIAVNTINTKLKPIRGNLVRFGRDITTPADASAFVDLLRSRQSPKTANANLKYCKTFGEWLVTNHFAESNLFAGIRPLKESQAKNPCRRPFKISEIQALLSTARTNPKFQGWHDFCAVLLFLGLRPSEAIGLRWKCVDLESRQILIAESLSRNPDGRSSGYARVQKTTKTGTERILPLVDPLVEILKNRQEQFPQHRLEDLVFLSPRGKVIDDHNFSQRHWKMLCEAAGVEYRVPYASRHTAISHILEKGGTPHQAAYIAGHKSPRMVMENYGHAINPPKMPDYEG